MGDSSNRYRWGLSDDVYSNGAFWQHSSSGWQEFSNYDGSFVIHYGNLENNTLYTVTIGNGVKDMAGNPMKEDYQFQFSTGAAVPEFSAMLPLLVILLAGIAIIRRRV